MFLNLQAMSAIELLRTHQAVIDALRLKGVVNTNNHPIGDYTEWLVCGRLGLERQANSKAAFDGIDTQGIKYQIKGRCSNAQSVQFSTVRKLEEHGFDYVVAVVFAGDYSVRQALKIPHKVFPKLAPYRGYVNGHILIWTPDTVKQPGVEDISDLLV